MFPIIIQASKVLAFFLQRGAAQIQYLRAMIPCFLSLCLYRSFNVETPLIQVRSYVAYERLLMAQQMVPLKLKIFTGLAYFIQIGAMFYNIIVSFVLAS